MRQERPIRDPAIASKVERFSAGQPLRVLDLFAGCGGISLGFQRASFRIVGAVEIDELAAKSHGLNFHRSSSARELELHSRPRDITKVEPAALMRELGLGATRDAIDVLVGGPPCQAYARVGRAKLREVADHPEAFRVDPRANLYLRYLHYVKELKPLALMMENVPDILHYGGHNVVQEMVETLDEMGYDARYSLINSAFHGVPQMRDRVFMVAFRKELRASIKFPKATHHMTLPRGYAGTRAVALRFVDLISGSAYVSPDLGKGNLPFPVTAEEALGDLPPITLHLEGKLKRGARRFTETVPYRKTRRLSAYAQEMRNWPGFENSSGVKDHVIRYLPRDTEIFREMPAGAEYPEANRVAARLFEQKAKKLRLAEGSAEYRRLRRQMVPPYPVGTFPNRWWKLRAAFPSRTLMAHLGKDCYSHIHYDSAQGRTISVREAARLQSFPDGFVFCGTMNPALRQIGNAVPPLMALALAKAMLRALTEAVQTPAVAAE